MQHWKWMLAAGLVASAACWQAGSASAATAAAAATAATAPAANTNNAAISLDFDASNYTEEHMDCAGQDVAYRAYRDIVYVAHPAAADAEQMNIFIPAAYFTGGTVNGYTAKTAPIFLPNGVGGYMPGMAGEPAIGDHGATGNSPDYAPYLSAIGAADERDDIFASMDYCPITNLEHADMAYEWMFSGVNEYHQSSMPPMAGGAQGRPPQGVQPPAADGAVTNRPANAPQETTGTQTMTGRQITASKALKALFPAYVNSLGLRDDSGQPLSLHEDGTGSFADYIKAVYMASAQSALDQGDTSVAALDWLTVQDGRIVDMDLAKYAAWAGRLKATPAFDKFDLSSGENDEFADSANAPKHFTAFSFQRSDKNGPMADASILRLMNPMNYIGSKEATVAPHWRIRHGAKDRDTSLAIPALLARKLQNAGYDVDFAAPWGKGHAGDYDLTELFDWADHICQAR